jgi:hypothetical protein
MKESFLADFIYGMVVITASSSYCSFFIIIHLFDRPFWLIFHVLDNNIFHKTNTRILYTTEEACRKIRRIINNKFHTSYTIGIDLLIYTLFDVLYNDATLNKAETLSRLSLCVKMKNIKTIRF